jgi:16S rRNA (adenine1518-N6/adenine1519-N6)-dimethyltransferase
MIQWRCRIEKLFKVAASAFTPPPKVSSTVVRLCPYDAPPVSVADPAVFTRVVKCAFAHRRKTLRNTLKDLVSNEIMTALDIDPGRRAETLSLEEFAALANAVSV